MDRYIIKARNVKQHYRRLPNGRVIFIDQHWDKRDKAKEDFNNTQHNVTHVDENSTTVVGADGEQRTFRHSQTKELNKDQIFAHLNNKLVMPDKQLAMDMIAEHYGIKNYDDFQRFLGSMPGDSEEDKEAYFDKNYLDKMLKKNFDDIGDITPASVAYTKVPHYKEYMDSVAKENPVESDDKQKNLHDMSNYALAHMLKNHADDAVASLAEEESAAQEANLRGPQDAPKIPYISSKMSFFPHQAETLAKLDVLPKAVVDVDMGGGKGLLLPADALNLMAKGLVKKPLIVAPGMTVVQNAKKMIEYTEGNVNVFCITNGIINKIYGGDIEALIEDIGKAPPNTVFMASYDVFSHQARAPEGMKAKEMPDDDRFARGLALSGCGFDMVSLDECFHPDTLVETIDGDKRIADIKKGDLVRNCLGYAPVIDTQYKKLDRRVVVEYEGLSITCSENHPWFTDNGWVLASELKEGDNLVKTDEAMRVVREGFFSSVQSMRNEQEQILWDILFSEMAYERHTEIGTILESRGENKCIEEGCIDSGLVFRSNEEEQSDVRRCNSVEDAINIAAYWAQTEGSLSEEENGTGGETSQCSRPRMEMGASSRSVEDRFGFPRKETCRRGGWPKSSMSGRESERCEKGSYTGFVRVDRVTVYEQGSDERNTEGLFYDITVAGHPSFSVGGVVVRNCHKIKNSKTARFKSMQYLTGAKYRRVASGTFISNEASDVYGQLKWLYPAWDMSLERFKERYGYEDLGKAGKIWRAAGLKRLRAELMEKGMISLRRSAWLDKLPQRNEHVSVVQMDKKHKAIHDEALEIIMDTIEDEMAGDKDFKKHQAYDELDQFLEDTPQLKAALEVIGSLSDYPDVVADIVEGHYEVLSKYSKDIGTDVVPDVEEAQRYLNRFPPDFRKKLLGLKGMVSPKAKDCYKVLDEHFKNPKNGKFIVFCQRKLSAAHIMQHMPEHLKKDAVYYDASKKDALNQFIKGKSPRIIVAVDASIKEGMNLQMANGMYRYDHSWSPGDQEQSYARIWRFGQEKPVDIHLGITDGGVDVPKYCRMISKYHQNMQVVSDYPEDNTFMIYRMNVSNIRDNRHAGIIQEYRDKMDDILDFEKQENRKIKQAYGDKGYKLGSSTKIPGSITKRGWPYYQDEDEVVDNGDDEKTVETMMASAPVNTKHTEAIMSKLKELGVKPDKATVKQIHDDVRSLLAHGGGKMPTPAEAKKYWAHWADEHEEEAPEQYVDLVHSVIKKGASTPQNSRAQTKKEEPKVSGKDVGKKEKVSGKQAKDSGKDKQPKEKTKEKLPDKSSKLPDHKKIMSDIFSEYDLDDETVSLAANDLKVLTRSGKPDASTLKEHWAKWAKKHGEKVPKPYADGVMTAIKKMYGDVKKSILGTLGFSQANDTAGDKITHMGKDRHAKVRSIIADALKNDSPVKKIAKKLQSEVGVKRGEKWRNWDMVAQTEVTDANGHASYELLKETMGNGALIYRDTFNCCPCSECEDLFGAPGKPKMHKIGKIPVKIRGSIHPSCRCGPWMSVDEPTMFKAAPYIMGLVKREFNGKDWNYFISDGKGKWFALDCLSGLSLVRYVLKCIPYVFIAEKINFNLARHGHGRPEDSIIRLISPQSIGNARFYPSNPFDITDHPAEFREYFMKENHTLDQYLEAIMKILPAVIKMPEYWEDNKKINYLTDFMGYKTLTNWWVLIPGTIPNDAYTMMGREFYPHSVHSAVKESVKKLMIHGEIRKGGKKAFTGERRKWKGGYYIKLMGGKWKKQNDFKLPPIKWSYPTDKELMNEVKSEFHVEQLFIKETWPKSEDYVEAIDILKKVSKPEQLDPKELKGRHIWDNYDSLVETVKGFGGPKDPDSMVAAIKEGKPLPMPIVVRHSDGTLEILGGATRSGIAALSGHKITALVIDAKAAHKDMADRLEKEGDEEAKREGREEIYQKMKDYYLLGGARPKFEDLHDKFLAHVAEYRYHRIATLLGLPVREWVFSGDKLKEERKKNSEG